MQLLITLWHHQVKLPWTLTTTKPVYRYVNPRGERHVRRRDDGGSQSDPRSAQTLRSEAVSQRPLWGIMILPHGHPPD